MINLLLTNWRALALLGACLAGIGLYLLGKHDARQQAAMEAAQATIQAIKKRAAIDAKITDLDGYALCLELGGLQSDCEQLRGLGENQP